MIHEVTGDILLTKAQVIAHGVAPNDDFTSVLALSLREHWPAMYKDFRHYCHTMHPKPGEIWIWANPEGKRIVNLFTQEAAYGHGVKPGRAKLEYVNHALRALHKAVEAEGFTSIALSRLATGVGGLSWENVFPLISKHFGESTIPIFVYTTFHKGLKADEKI
ncbi:MAG TPA: macro domain-containing protein [Candidatus Brocadiaceae bacterium]